MKAVILAGGSGKRLWPLSRENYPKQFLPVTSDRSLLQETVERALDYTEEILVVTNGRQYFHTLYQLEDLGLNEKNILTEPKGRNTAPAIYLATLYSKEISGDENLLILPSDHMLSEEFFAIAGKAESCAKDYILTFGIKPTYPAMGYGYIKYGQDLGRCNTVEEFTEKPSPEKAKEFLKNGRYLWNSGIFLFNTNLMLEEFESHLPEISKYPTSQELLENYKHLPKISVDYGIMEKTKRIAVVPFNGIWQDVGSWESVHKILPKDEEGNAIKGDVINLDTKWIP